MDILSTRISFMLKHMEIKYFLEQDGNTMNVFYLHQDLF